MNVNLTTAVIICKNMFDALSPIGYYPALTGGCLYKDGDRKDIDIVIYRNRQQHEFVDMGEVMNRLEEIGIVADGFFGFVTKTHLGDICIDLFDPEAESKDNYE